jgi:hypothetical protein
MRRFVESTILLLLFSFALAFPARTAAQAAGNLRGQVLDPSGAAVPGASVTLSQGSTVLTSQSGNDGAYSFQTVGSGSYTLAVEATGFATVTKTGIVITAGQTRQRNAQVRHLSLHGSYTFNDARSDTQGVTYVPPWRKIPASITAVRASA